MPSRSIPLEDLRQRSVMFWLPPGGRDNGVWADTWVIIAEVEPADAAPILDSLRDEDIGGYVADPSGRKATTNPGKRLYVDREQHSQATDVLMLYLRNKNRPLQAAERRTPVVPRARTKIELPAAIRILLMAVEIVLVAAFFALVLLLVYYRGAQLFPTVHPTHQQARTIDGDGSMNR
jgi:hypothetical protein